jgi:hypothetical protein
MFFLRFYYPVVDFDECDGGNNGCSQICVNTPGSFVCDCNQGYRLEIDQKTCNGKSNHLIDY